MVSIHCLVYNHAPYLRQCLDGFVMQKTNFRFEAIVHDDCSPDNSADIIREYAEKYPDIIKPIYETENQHSKHDGSLRRIMFERLTGKYIAMCEGDDYWIDHYKLQKQVDFLENNPDYVMCYTNFNLFYEETNKMEHDMLSSGNAKFRHEFTLPEWIAHPGYIGPMTWLVRNEIWKNIPKISTSDGTYVYVAHFMSKGKMKCMIDDTTAVYRSHRGSITQSSSFKTQYWQRLNFFYAMADLADYYLDGTEDQKAIKEHAISSFFNDSFCKKIICYGSEKDLGILKSRKNTLSNSNRLLLSVTAFPPIRNIFRRIYLYLIHKKTGLYV